MPSYTADEVALNERFSIKNGVFSIVGLTVVGNFASLFILKPLHGTSEEVAMLTSLPALMSIAATWIGASWLARSSEKRRFCVRSTATARVFYLLLAVAPLLVRPPLAATVVVALIALMNLPQALSGLSWQSMIGDLIPSERRGEFFGRRNRAVTMVSLVATLVPGLVLQAFPVRSIPPYQVFFLLAFGFAAFEVYYLVRHVEHPDKPSASGARGLTPKMFVELLRRPEYRRFLAAALVFNLGWQMAWPLFSIYQIRDAGATGIWISAFNVAAQVSQILTYSRWGRLAERFGNTSMLAVACFGMALTPVLTVLSPNLPYLTFVNFASGLFFAGLALLQFNHLLEVAPAQERTTYIAHFNIMIGLVGFVAPQLGVALLALVHMTAAMSISSALRVAATGMLLWTASRHRRGGRDTWDNSPGSAAP